KGTLKLDDHDADLTVSGPADIEYYADGLNLHAGTVGFDVRRLENEAFHVYAANCIVGAGVARFSVTTNGSQGQVRVDEGAVQIRFDNGLTGRTQFAKAGQTVSLP